MPAPFSISCPSCQARLKIQNPNAVGKKVRCPKCETPFTVRPPSSGPPRRKKKVAAPPPEDDFGFEDEEDFEDYEAGGADDFDSYDDYGDSYDNYDDDFGAPASPRRSSRSGAAKKRGGKSKTGQKKRSKKKAPGGPSPLLIGGGALAVCLLIGLLIFAFKGGGSSPKGSDGNIVDLTYIPQDAVVIGYVDMQSVLSNPKIQEQLQNDPNTKRNLEKFTKETGIELDDIESIVVGIPQGTGGAKEPDAERLAVVVRLNTAVSRVRIKADRSLTEVEQNGVTYYKGDQSSQELCFFLADGDKTMVFGKGNRNSSGHQSRNRFPSQTPVRFYR